MALYHTTTHLPRGHKLLHVSFPQISFYIFWKMENEAFIMLKVTDGGLLEIKKQNN